MSGSARRIAFADDDGVPNTQQHTAGVLSSAAASATLAAAHAEPPAVEEIGLTESQSRLLYLVSLYTRPARTTADKEEWIRKQALLVLVYEAVVAQVLDYDYAPAASIVQGRRVFFNRSQEGAADLDFLREEGLLNGLKLASTQYQPVTCYQISEKGQALARRVPKVDRDAVAAFAHAPGTRELLRVQWRVDRFLLIGPGGFERASTVLDCEDVSYVGSAYIPQCLRFGGRPTLSNAHRAAECALAASNVRDELNEVITLNSVSIVVAEWIPFGANQVVAMNANLGSQERVQGGFFTALIDDDASGTKFVVDPGLTAINVLDFSPARHINFEADIHVPEAAGIMQVETFGVSLNADGSLFYGMQVEAVMDRVKDNISLDTLARLLVDVTVDSSTIVDSVLSAYQRKLLSLVFAGAPGNRDKVNLIIANEVTPHLTAEEYMDKGAYENELRQVLGDTRAAFDISEHDTLVFGSSGLLLAGPNARRHEPLLCAYLQFNALDVFIRSFFSRMFLVNDAMRTLRATMNAAAADPGSLLRIHAQLQALNDDVRMLGEVLLYMSESLDGVEIPPEPTDPAGRALYARLQIADLAGQLSVRVLDLKKTTDGVRQELAHVRVLASVVAESRQFRLHEGLQASARTLVALNETHERSAASLRVMMLALCGLLAFAVLDRITGSWSVMDSTWFSDFATPMIHDTPLVWFIINMAFWAGIATFSVKALALLAYARQGVLTFRVRVNQRLVMERWAVFLASKNSSSEERVVHDERNLVVRQSWIEGGAQAARDYGGALPTITVEFDKTTSFLHEVTIEYPRRLAPRGAALTSADVRNRLAQQLEAADVFEDASYSFFDKLEAATRDGSTAAHAGAASFGDAAGATSHQAISVPTRTQ